IRVGDRTASDVVVRRLESEPVATFDLANAPGDDIGLAFHELEVHVRDLGVRAPRPPGSIPDENLIFVPVRRALPTTDRIGYRRLRATRAATLLVQGEYRALPAAIAGLAGWAGATGHEPAAALRILYLQFGRRRICASRAVGRSMTTPTSSPSSSSR